MNRRTAAIRCLNIAFTHSGPNGFSTRERVNSIRCSWWSSEAIISSSSSCRYRGDTDRREKLVLFYDVKKNNTQINKLIEYIL